MRSQIPNQVRLPISVACEVVMQGIRIRLGRSIVTITGVVCGIAFFMSILTGQIIKKGVASEDERRESVSRIQNFMASDMPVLRRKKVGLLGTGELDEVETRVLEKLMRNGVGAIVTIPGAKPAMRRKIDGLEEVRGVDELASAASAVLVMGDGPLPDVEWQTILGVSRNMVVGTTRPKAQAPPVAPERLVLLSREFTEEELEKKRLDARKQKFRSVWITVISLLVTVIGISNAMLMSVTERFREIGTMKCLGSLSSFIRRIFILESSLMGLVGGVIGAIVGALFSIGVYAVTYGPGLVFSSLDVPPIFMFGLCSAAAGIILSVIAALYPARVASNMVPATALRSTV
jgi:hypothetical protein